MLTRNRLLSIIPHKRRRQLRDLRAAALKTPLNRFFSKYDSEMRYWQDRLRAEDGTFAHGHYERIMMGMAQEDSQEFLRDKIIADFGCGPRGSLEWAEAAKVRIGIDVLADRYADEFPDNIRSHRMVYVKSTEKIIPLPSDSLDVLITLNALDHVNQFAVMCQELLRILKPGGLFLGSFNLEEPATSTEPQCLTEGTLQENLLQGLRIESYRLSRRPSNAVDLYADLLNGTASYSPGEEGFLWVKARKPNENETVSFSAFSPVSSRLP